MFTLLQACVPDKWSVTEVALVLFQFLKSFQFSFSISIYIISVSFLSTHLNLTINIKFINSNC